MTRHTHKFPIIQNRLISISKDKTTGLSRLASSYDRLGGTR